MAYNRLNYLKKVVKIQQLTNEHYEIGRQDRCYKWVWKYYIQPTFYIGYGAYIKVLGINVKLELNKEYNKIDPAAAWLFKNEE